MTTTVEDCRSVDHAVAVPVSDEQLWQISAEFLAHGLGRGEHVIYFDDGSSDRVLERMTDDGVAVAGPLREGRFTIVPSDRHTSPHEVAEAVRASVDAALAAGYPAVRITGRLSFPVTHAAGEAGVAHYDRVVDEVVRNRPAHVLCIYDRTRYPEGVVEAMRAAHRTEVIAPAIYDDGLLRITAIGPGAAHVAGECDHSNRPRIRSFLEAALDRALRQPDAPTDITLDLSSLRFLDVAGAVGLVHAAEEFPDAHRLILTGVRPRVQRVLDRCGAPFATQLVVRARSDQPPVEQPPAVRPPAPQAPAVQARAAQAAAAQAAAVQSPADRPPVDRPSPEQAPA
ncbi:anti-anti-sigma factor [Pseudonocardia hierapolitana]|uniref:Anti-anti-sigma factor n=1 Tax=Pseudonocardia hierapolitana TaxID=1128676 RepID=A0A561T2V6_9PSEU|nr:MEDS domain-containing protein [Pseudonocardia hierapolitana]TWF81444.1 anti-anti-sigma factor [Pseudonocardia hierapolitana]